MTNPGADFDNNVLRAESAFTYKNMAAKELFTIKEGPGLLHSLVVNTIGTGSTVVLYNNTDADDGAIIATINTGLGSLGRRLYDLAFTTGLAVGIDGTNAPDITVTYR
jgi:hypothetical protein